MTVRNPDRTRRNSTDTGRDEGSALVLVLVLMVIGSLVVIPLMQYAMAVTAANTVLSDKTERLEGVKAGLRVALARPNDLYQTCGAAGPTVGVPLASVAVNDMTVTTQCYYIDYQAAQSAEEIRRGAVATQMGQTAPEELRGTTWSPTGTAADEWWAETTKESETDKIWLPNLPAHGLDIRPAAGYAMPSGFPACTVYFPGTYRDPITLSGPTYFPSGVYYFENTVTVAGGASVTAGQGASAGCTTDQEAAFYAVNAPSTHNIGGLGATWVFGAEGRLLVDNTGSASISLLFNQRYVADGDPAAAPSAGVSIASVNGDIDPTTLTGIDLVLPDELTVPLSMVGAEPDPEDPDPVAPVPALGQDYLPSTLTPRPSAPDAPTNASAIRRVGSALVSWDAPADGGTPITGYNVIASTGGGCTTLGATTCAVTGLTNGVPVTFSVVATNAIGDSDPSAPSASVTPGGTTSLTVPGAPTPPSFTPYDSAVRVTWTAPASTGGAPITSYIVTATPGGQSCSLPVDLATAPTLTCDITGLANNTPVNLSIVATNAVGTSAPSGFSASVTPMASHGAVPPPPVVPPVAFQPPAILEFELPSAAPVTVSIPGYISVPQGRVRINNPNGLDVNTTGGILAAQFDLVADARAAGPQSLPMGFVETVVQRKFRIVSSTPAGGERSVAIVQVNQNGAYAINSWEVQ